MVSVHTSFQDREVVDIVVDVVVVESEFFWAVDVEQVELLRPLPNDMGFLDKELFDLEYDSKELDDSGIDLLRNKLH